MNSFISMEFPVGDNGPHPPKSYTPRCVPVKCVLAATMSPSAIRRSTWYSKSGKAVSQAESACLHFSRLVFFSSLSDMPGATISSITARLPLFQSSSKYLRITALFCSADITRPFVRMEVVLVWRRSSHDLSTIHRWTPRCKGHQSRCIWEVCSRSWCAAPEQPGHGNIPGQITEHVDDGQQ